MDWLFNHAGVVLAGLMFAEKVVLVSKSKHNDIIVSAIKIFSNFLSKKGK